jgi:hypothetical protein
MSDLGSDDGCASGSSNGSTAATVMISQKGKRARRGAQRRRRGGRARLHDDVPGFRRWPSWWFCTGTCGQGARSRHAMPCSKPTQPVPMHIAACAACTHITDLQGGGREEEEG